MAVEIRRSIQKLVADGRLRFGALTFLAAAVLLSVAETRAQIFSQLNNPRELTSQRNIKRGGDLNFDLEIKYAYNSIFNPATGQNDRVYLRSYNGQLAGPTMRVLPGQTLRINLMNNLPVNDPSCKSNQNVEIPHCYNSTNLHTHGWHVSPTGNSDNVLLDIAPGVSFDYEYYLPKDHPAGTFWYHSHRHGSTAIQVSSGMAGVLLVEGFRQLKDKPINGIADIDTILKYVNGRRYEDRIMMFQQIQYACVDAKGNPVNDPNTGNPVWNCPTNPKVPGQVGGIEQYGTQFGPGTWAQSGRFTTINGQVQPIIRTETGKLERWRLIHAGVRDTINFNVRRANLNASTPAEMEKALADVQKLPPAQQADWLAKNCYQPGGDVTQIEMAVDGLTRKQMSAKTQNILQPGYRSDVLMSFDRPGIYCVADEELIPQGSINSIAPAANLTEAKTAELNGTALLGMVFVSGGKPYTESAQDYTAAQLIAANPDLPAAVKDDLKALRVPEFVPHRDVLPSEVTGKQENTFAIRLASDTTTTLFQIAKKYQPEQQDYFSYDPDRIDRVLTLGGVDEWWLSSGSIGHPFHIHVNPFQIIEILKPDGTSVVGADGKCSDGGDPQYCDQIGIWRDTLFVKNPNFNPTGLNEGKNKGYLIKMRTRYERYVGDFVLHCHILDHEDQGMMQNIRIAPAGGYFKGNPVPTKSAGPHKH